MTVKETDKNPCLYQAHGLIQLKYIGSYSNFPPVKEENIKLTRGIGNVHVGGWILDRVLRASLNEKSTFEMFE